MDMVDKASWENLNSEEKQFHYCSSTAITELHKVQTLRSGVKFVKFVNLATS